MKSPRIHSLFLLTLASSTTASKDDNIVTVTADTPEPTSDASYTDGTLFKSTILNTTNTYRTQHSAPSLTWNETIARFSARHASKCNLKHSGGPYGENLAIGYPNASATVEAWGEERKNFDYGDDAEFSKETGHFTQLVWNDTRQVGCGREECDGKGWIVVCGYWPRGNVVGEFGDMVGEKEDAAVTVRAGMMAIMGALLWVTWWL